MTDCQHDPTYRIENEANGGIGCPICQRNRNASRWSTDAERETWQQEGANEAQAAADARMAEYAMWQENVKDWNDIKGDCDL